MPDNMHDLSPIVLAAGSSSRFGGPKLMQPLTGDRGAICVLSQALQPWLTSFPDVWVVVPPEHKALRAQVEQELDAADRIHWLACDQSASGMGHSLAFAVAQTQHASGWLIGLGDMPDIHASTLQSLAEKLASGHALIAPVHAGKRGHPVGFNAQFRQPLMACQGDQGARQIVQDHMELLVTLDVDDAGVLFDIDTVADWQRRESAFAAP
jgi:molybdenum cofactor cytidylyltransferase